MTFAGRFWLLWEDEPIDMDRGTVVDLRDGAILDGRTGALRGTYGETPEGVELVFDLEDGEQQIARFGRHSEARVVDDRWQQARLPFDPDADGFTLTWSTVRYEAYLALRPALADDDEDLEHEREHAEGVLFGIVPTYGAALRDGPRIQEMHEANQQDTGEPMLLH